MPAKDDKKKRAAPISYRPPKDREAEFYERVAASGLPINAFLNALVFGKRFRPVRKKQAAARALVPASRLRERLDELMLVADERHDLLLEAALDDLDELRGELMGDMGYKP